MIREILPPASKSLPVSEIWLNAKVTIHASDRTCQELGREIIALLTDSQYGVEPGGVGRAMYLRIIAT